MMRGTVKWFNPQKGYGFIKDQEGKDLFFHYSQIQMNGFKLLHEYDIVDFEVKTGENGKEQAVNISPILTMKMIEDVLEKDNLYVNEFYANKNTIMMNTLKVKKFYMVVDEDDLLQSDENGMTFLELAKYAGFEIDEFMN